MNLELIKWKNYYTVKELLDNNFIYIDKTKDADIYFTIDKDKYIFKALQNKVNIYYIDENKYEREFVTNLTPIKILNHYGKYKKQKSIPQLQDLIDNINIQIIKIKNKNGLNL